MPLVHVNIGSGFYKAKGLLQSDSKGIISIGVVSRACFIRRRRARLRAMAAISRPVVREALQRALWQLPERRRRVCPWRGCRGRVERGAALQLAMISPLADGARRWLQSRTAKRHRNHPGAGPWGHYQRNEGAGL